MQFERLFNKERAGCLPACSDNSSGSWRKPDTKAVCCGDQRAAWERGDLNSSPAETA